MIAADLRARMLELPLTSRYSIVVITGTELRHERFALRLQQEFGDLVVAWISVQRRAAPRRSRQRRLASAAGRLATAVRRPRSLGGILSKLRQRACEQWLRAQRWLHFPPQNVIEDRLFGHELKELRKSAVVRPIIVDDPNATKVIEMIRALHPYFIVTLGGAIYQAPLLAEAVGLALNQHDGWCPDYKGSHTTDWALYRRDIPHLGNTIHVLTSGLDSGPIVRRSTACIIPSDTPQSCFARSVALGTELMCEVIAEIIRDGRVTVYDQPAESGRTYLSQHMTRDIKDSITRDLLSGWLGGELTRLQQF